jgi:hypothetical protein
MLDAPSPATSARLLEQLEDPYCQTPPGFEHNRGPAYIPSVSETKTHVIRPACYIWAHMDAPNPFVEGQLSLEWPDLPQRDPCSGHP